MRAFVRRWWIFPAGIAAGVFVAWLAGRVFPPPIYALFMVASVVILLGIFCWRQAVWKRRARAALFEALVNFPVYLTSDLWAVAKEAGLVTEEDMAAIRRRQDERRAAQRAEEEQS